MLYLNLPVVSKFERSLVKLTSLQPIKDQSIINNWMCFNTFVESSWL